MDNTRKSYIYFVRLPLVLAILLLSLVGICSRRGWLDLRRMRLQNAQLQQKLYEGLAQKQALEKELESFRADSIEQERIVRQTLGYVRRNEIIVQFD
jgi:cell division protein FtsB